MWYTSLTTCSQDPEDPPGQGGTLAVQHTHTHIRTHTHTHTRSQCVIKCVNTNLMIVFTDFMIIDSL